MNKRGFTLVELLVVIVIIALLSGIGTVSYIAFINYSKEKVYTNYEDSMKDAINMYLIDSPDTVPSNSTSSLIPISTLIGYHYLSPIKNPDDVNDLCSDSYVKIARNSDFVPGSDNNNIDLDYEICLKCNKYESSTCETLAY